MCAIERQCEKLFLCLIFLRDKLNKYMWREIMYLCRYLKSNIVFEKIKLKWDEFLQLITEAVFVPLRVHWRHQGRGLDRSAQIKKEVENRYINFVQHAWVSSHKGVARPHQSRKGLVLCFSWINQSLGIVFWQHVQRGSFCRGFFEKMYLSYF